jgi:hypothetical protein
MHITANMPDHVDPVVLRGAPRETFIRKKEREFKPICPKDRANYCTCKNENNADVVRGDTDEFHCHDVANSAAAFGDRQQESRLEDNLS